MEGQESRQGRKRRHQDEGAEVIQIQYADGSGSTSLMEHMTGKKGLARAEVRGDASPSFLSATLHVPAGSLVRLIPYHDADRPSIGNQHRHPAEAFTRQFSTE